MITKEVRGKKVYIYLKDELTGIEFSTEVDKVEFELCVKKWEELGATNPEKSALLNYVLIERCAMPISRFEKFKKFLKEFLGA